MAVATPPLPGDARDEPVAAVAETSALGPIPEEPSSETAHHAVTDGEVKATASPHGPGPVQTKTAKKKKSKSRSAQSRGPTALPQSRGTGWEGSFSVPPETPHPGHVVRWLTLLPEYYAEPPLTPDEYNDEREIYHGSVVLVLCCLCTRCAN